MQITITRMDGSEVAANLFFSAASLENIQETGCDVQADLTALVQGSTTEDALLEHCLDGADEDRETGWREYVAELRRCAAALGGRAA